MDNGDKETIAAAFLAIVSVLIVFLAGLNIGYEVCKEQMQDTAIEQGVAHFDPTTAEFVWGAIEQKCVSD